MVIRIDETDRFPLEETWFFIVSFQNGIVEQEDFTAAQYAKNNLIMRIEQYTETYIPFKLYGVWHGQWKTDVFNLDPKLMVRRLTADLEEIARAKAKKKAQK